MTVLTLHKAGPAMTVQDLGRPGYLTQGLSQGGAADRLALLEAAALLGQKTPMAALEMAGAGGSFSVDAPTRFVLTGARMRATLDGVPVPPYTSQLMPPGAVLQIGGAEAGCYGYLAFPGGVMSAEWLQSRSAHLVANIGKYLASGDTLALGRDTDPNADTLFMEPEARLSGGRVRVMPGPQTALFSEAVRRRFFGTLFKRAPQGNRQGAKLDFQGEAFMSATKALASDFITPGDIQMTGEGQPYVLLSECQTLGGYPRIGTVIPADLPKVAQATAGAALQFEDISLSQADALWKSDTALLKTLRTTVKPRIRNPRDIPDLLRYQLVSGATKGDELENR